MANHLLASSPVSCPGPQGIIRPRDVKSHHSACIPVVVSEKTGNLLCCCCYYTTTSAFSDVVVPGMACLCHSSGKGHLVGGERNNCPHRLPRPFLSLQQDSPVSLTQNHACIPEMQVPTLKARKSSHFQPGTHPPQSSGPGRILPLANTNPEAKRKKVSNTLP